MQTLLMIMTLSFSTFNDLEWKLQKAMKAIGLQEQNLKTIRQTSR